MSGHTAPRRALEDVVARISGTNRLRTWSVIVSVFGDAVLPRGTEIQASVLQSILATLGIEPGAMRTALSRLAKDGWIESRRSGRTTAYRLTSSALAETDLASQTIYAPMRPCIDAAPLLALWPDQAEVPTHPALIPLRRGAAICAAKAIPDSLLAGALVTELSGANIPDWVQAAVAPLTQAVQFKTLIADFAPLSTAASTADALSPEESVAARVLLIHTWRRLALRLTALPEGMMPTDWPEPACRTFVLDLHARLSVAADPWLDAFVANGVDKATPTCHKIKVQS